MSRKKSHGQARPAHFDDGQKTPPIEVTGEASLPEDTGVTSITTEDGVEEDVVAPPPRVARRVDADEDRLVVVNPRKTVLNCRIGLNYFSFLKGQSVKVPNSIVSHLRDKDII